ncbi:MAG: ATP-binding protein [Sphingobacteriales bacterium]
MILSTLPNYFIVRIDSKNTRHISGFGIGLYLSAEIINHHGGKVWAEKEVGTGSTFYFNLPVFNVAQVD